MIKRMMSAAKLDTSVFEEVEADSSATRQAMAVVVVVALATGIGIQDRRPGWSRGRYPSIDWPLGTLGVDHLLNRNHHIEER